MEMKSFENRLSVHSSGWTFTGVDATLFVISHVHVLQKIMDI